MLIFTIYYYFLSKAAYIFARKSFKYEYGNYFICIIDYTKSWRQTTRSSVFGCLRLAIFQIVGGHCTRRLNWRLNIVTSYKNVELGKIQMKWSPWAMAKNGYNINQRLAIIFWFLFVWMQLSRSLKQKLR